MSNWGLLSSRSSMPDLFRDGSTQIDGYLKKHREEKWTAKVKSVSIYKTPLRQQPLDGKVPLIPTVTHHFLIVEVTDVSHPSRPGGENVNGRQLIRAEKLAQIEYAEKNGERNKENTGITVRYVPFIEESDHEKIHSVDALDVSIPIAQLVQILVKHSPDYDLLRDNCWKYADATLKALLKMFGDLHPEERTRMDRHLDAVPTLYMPIEVAQAMTASVVAVGGMALLLTAVYKGLRAFFSEEEEKDK